MKNFWTRICIFNWTHRMVVVPLVSAIALLAVAVGALYISNSYINDLSYEIVNIDKEYNEAIPEASEVPSPVASPESTDTVALGQDYTTKNYVICHVAGDSMEKDLNLYVTDATGAKVSGFSYKCKLVEASHGSEIAAYTAEIKKTSAAIKAETAHGADFNTLNQLYKDKEDAVAAYVSYVETLSGNLYSDDDSDGHVYLKDMIPGTYVACYLPESDLDPDDYISYVTVKDHIEYAVLENIEQQVGNYDASSDSGDHHAAEGETNEENTFVEATSALLPVKKSAGGVATVTFTDENKTVEVKVLQSESDKKGVTFEGQISDGENFSATLDKTYLEADGVIKVTVTVKMSGAKQEVEIPVVITEPAAGDKITDENGHILYSDTKKTLATAADVAAGKKLYYDSAEGAIDLTTGEQAPTTTAVATTSAVSAGNIGIDVSKYQGDINWSKVAGGGIKFAFIRAGGRYTKGENAGKLYEDPYFYQNMSGARAAGLSVGAYFYSSALTEAEAIEEASLIVSMVRSAGGTALPIYIDLEDTVRGVNKLSNSQRTAIINAFCSTVQSAGYNAGVYASRNWFRDKINTGSIPSSVNIWVAMYSDQLEYSGRFNIWQYSCKGKVPGIAGEVDLNLSF